MPRWLVLCAGFGLGLLFCSVWSEFGPSSETEGVSQERFDQVTKAGLGLATANKGLIELNDQLLREKQELLELNGRILQTNLNLIEANNKLIAANKLVAIKEGGLEHGDVDEPGRD